MKKTSQVYLKHILDAINKIGVYVDGINKQQFLDNYMMQDAVIRKIEVIGEASVNIRKVDRNIYQELNIKKSVGMRNVLIHDYDQVDIQIIWQTVVEDIPKLKISVSDLLTKFK